MGATTNEVEVCNLALTEINQRLITSLDSEPDDSPQQTYCKLVYPTARKSLLEAYDWSFALTRIKLDPVKIYSANKELVDVYPNLYTDKYFGWNTCFQIPADCLKISGVYDSNWHRQINVNGITMPWVRQGNYIYSQESYSGKTGDDGSFDVTLPVLNLQYVQDIEDVNMFSPSFIEALALSIAKKLTKQFNNSAAFLQFLDMKFDNALREAKIRDFRQTNTDGLISFPMLDESMRF